jgi:hypothetical protein
VVSFEYTACFRVSRRAPHGEILAGGSTNFGQVTDRGRSIAGVWDWVDVKIPRCAGPWRWTAFGGTSAALSWHPEMPQAGPI